MMSASKCAVAFFAIVALAASAAASPAADVELDKVDGDILVVRVTEEAEQQQQRERQERRLDSASSSVGRNSPVTIDFFEEKDTGNGGEIVEEIQVQG